jgi:predicted NBD/HSP70 family sugar kinase
MKVLAIDVGGTHVKILTTDQKEPLKFVSGPKMTAKQMVYGVKKLAAGWNYDAVSIGYPGPIVHGRIAHEPHNLGSGWVNFDFEKAFGCGVKVINDATMQALGSYKGGSMLFLGWERGLARR